MKYKKLQQLLMLLTCFFLILTIAINRDRKVFGQRLDSRKEKKATPKEATQTLSDGTLIINTTSLAKDISGYGGTTPLKITVKEGIITDIKAMKNSETPDFFNKASQLFDKWKGKSVDEALDTKVDAVSGATFSSKAIIANVQRGLQYAKNNNDKKPANQSDLPVKTIIGLLAVLIGAIVPLFFHNKTFRTLQLLVNVIILGLWCGTFMSYSLIISYTANGINLWTSLIGVIMLITAIVYPLLGKKSYYCNNLCPYGSLQELAGMCSKRKLKMSTKTTKLLIKFRKALWVVLMILMITSLWFEWEDYELFTAFMFQNASVAVIALALLFVILSIFVPRPYCRFVCPTGTLFKFCQNSK